MKLRLVLLVVAAAALTLQGQPVDLLKKYPTQLSVGDAAPDRARHWEFTDADIFRVSRFSLSVGNGLQMELGAADLGIGHCADGAVWAVLLPVQDARLTSQTAKEAEAIAHVWLRFHPKELSHLFPPETVSRGGNSNCVARIRSIANAKMTSSWQAGGNAMIPEPKDLTVDVDTKNGPRRFFVVDTEAQTAEYVPAFENRAVKQPPPFDVTLAERAFDQLWRAFDKDYAMFSLRPEVDWVKLRDQYRPKALASQSSEEFAAVCADLLKPLRDLHVWLTLAGAHVPVFNRPRSANSNPAAHRALLGDLQKQGRIQWAVTPDKIGFLAIYGWDNPRLPAQCDQVLENLRDTRGLIVDVRLNGGGSEDQAEGVAGRFLKETFVYAYSQFRNGPGHSNLTQKMERRVAPRGPWRYDRPVVLLIGQKCMSSNESFVAMMSGDPDITIMGDHTCGSSGNPEIIKLPLDMTVSVPRWIDYLPDGTPLDERGFQPQVRFEPTPGAFYGERDDLLAAALDRLRQAPLPETPIPGAQGASELPLDSVPPVVVETVPAAGALDVDPGLTEIRVTFSKTMQDGSWSWSTWGQENFPETTGKPRYIPGQRTCVLPVKLVPGKFYATWLNSDNFTNFKDAGGQSAVPFLLTFQTAGAEAKSK